MIPFPWQKEVSERASIIVRYFSRHWSLSLGLMPPAQRLFSAEFMIFRLLIKKARKKGSSQLYCVDLLRCWQKLKTRYLRDTASKLKSGSTPACSSLAFASFRSSYYKGRRASLKQFLPFLSCFAEGEIGSRETKKNEI